MRLKWLLVCLPALAWTTLACGHAAALGDYPERFPGKTLQAIVREWEPPPENTWGEGDLQQAVQALASRWTKLSIDALKTEVGSVLEENRRGEYRKRFANVLHEMEDLLAGGEEGHTVEAADYLAWRVDHMTDDDGFFDEAPPGPWDETRQKKEERTRQWEHERYKEVSEISVKAETASVALRPHWLVQCGALEFRHRRYREATDFFERVRTAFPGHPRAEAAVLMLARIKLDEWKQQRSPSTADSQNEFRIVDQVSQAFQSYSMLYPKGRFLADVTGWEAGMSQERGCLGSALEGYLQQAQTPGHPEIRRRAFQQIEWLLRQLVKDPKSLDSLPWVKIAAEPCVALRLGYFMLDCHSELDLGALMDRRSGGDHRVLETLAPELAAVRAAARHAWVLLDASLAADQVTYRGKQSLIRDVLHGWSAIVRGTPSVVPALVEEQKQGPGTDDVLLVRALAKLKMGLPAEGIRGLEELDEICPASPLRRGGDLRRVDAWLELHQPAAVIGLIGDMLTGSGTAARKQEMEESPPLHLPGEADQRLSALLTFAPLAELEKASLAEGVPAGLKTVLRGSLRVRHLSEGRFAESLRFAETSDFENWREWHLDWGDRPEKVAAGWRDSLSTLQTLSEVVRHASDEARAAAWMSLGAAWEQRLWRLLDGGMAWLDPGYSLVSLPSPSYELRHHAGLLGLSDATAAAMLDQRQETTQAIHCYEEALKLARKGSPVSLKALLALQSALRTRAGFSPYCMDRAAETNAAAQSRMLHDRILSEHAGTDAARQAVWWTFRPSHTLGDWQPGQSGLFRSEVELAELLTASKSAGYWDATWQFDQSIKQITEQLKTAFSAETDAEKLRDAIASLRRVTRREAPVAKAGPLLNHLDDLDLLLQVPGVSGEARKAYLDARMSSRPLDASADMFAPMQDFVSFWNAAITPSTNAVTLVEQTLLKEQPERGARQRIAQAQVCRMQDFLVKFPQSVKREAALARQAINTVRQFRCHCGMSWINEVEDATTTYAGFAIERGMPFDPAAVTAALDAYDREFPQGRYHWDVLLMRGIAAAELRDWPAAMRHLLAVLDNPQKRDLHLDASNNLCAVFMELLTPEQRPGVIHAIKAAPGAWQKLDAFILSPTCGWQLRILGEWLETQR